MIPVNNHPTIKNHQLNAMLPLPGFSSSTHFLSKHLTNFVWQDSGNFTSRDFLRIKRFCHHRMVGSCGSGTSAPSDLQDIKPGQVRSFERNKNYFPTCLFSFRSRLRTNGTTTMSLFFSGAVLVNLAFKSLNPFANLVRSLVQIISTP